MRNIDISNLCRAIAVFSTFELICSSFRVAKLSKTHTIFFSNMTSSREEKKTYADAVKGRASPLRNTWWRRLQEVGEEETIFIAMKRSVEELKVVSNKGYAANLTLPTFPSFWPGGPTHLHEMEAMTNETYYFIESSHNLASI